MILTIFQASKHEQEAERFQATASSSLTGIEGSSDSLIRDGIKDDASSGSTPRKRKWQYRDDWSLTKPREELLKNSKGTDAGIPEELKTVESSETIPEESRRTKIAEPRHRRTASSMSENAGPSEQTELAKVLPGKQDLPTSTEPLIDSKKRNAVSVRSSSRRLR